VGTAIVVAVLGHRGDGQLVSDRIDNPFETADVAAVDDTSARHGFMFVVPDDRTTRGAMPRH
jgi:hypothetical protein